MSILLLETPGTKWFALIRRAADGLYWSAAFTFLAKTTGNWASVYHILTKTDNPGGTSALHQNPCTGLPEGVYDLYLFPYAGSVPLSSDENATSPFYYVSGLNWDEEQFTPVTVLAGAGGVQYIGVPIGSSLNEVTQVVTTGGAERTLVLFQNAKSVVEWKLTSADGSPIDLTGHAFRFVVHTEEGVPAFSIDSVTHPDQIDLLESPDADAGAPDTVRVTILPVNVTLVGAEYEYKVWDLTLELPIGFGEFVVRQAPRDSGT